MSVAHLTVPNATNVYCNTVLATGTPYIFTRPLAPLSVPSNTLIPVELKNVISIGGGFPTQEPTTRSFTPTLAGWYLLMYHIRFTTQIGPGRAQAFFAKNGVDVYGDSVVLGGSSEFIPIDGSAMIQFNGTTDLVRLEVYQTTTSTLIVNETATEMQMHFLHA